MQKIIDDLLVTQGRHRVLQPFMPDYILQFQVSISDSYVFASQLP